MFKKILVGYDGSKGGKAALRRAVVLANEFKALITALWVREPLPRYTDLPGEPESEAEAADEYFQDRQKEVAEVAAQHGIKVGCETRREHPAKTIVTMATEDNYDLIVVGPQRPLGIVGASPWRHGGPHQRPCPLQRAHREELRLPISARTNAL